MRDYSWHKRSLCVERVRGRVLKVVQIVLQ